jgi:putative transcriptional regulator
MDLTGSIIVASPNVDENSYFARTVIYIVKYSTTEGTVGLIINHPLNKLENTLYVKHNNDTLKLNQLNVYSGGPVDTDKGFILHFDRKVDKSHHPIQITSNINMLKKLIQQKRKSKNSLFVFGYCGWDIGQIEEEIVENYWLVLPKTDKNIVFDIKNNKKWESALTTLNIAPERYSSYIGRG